MSSQPRIGNVPAPRTVGARALKLVRGAAHRPLLRRRGYRFGRLASFEEAGPVGSASDEQRVLLEYARQKTGRGLWKWMHYYDIYERHLGKFVGQEVNVVEIGVYSGGSLDMWRDYLGPHCHVHGVDIAEACRAYSGEQVSITIGDQADRRFWREFLRERPSIDIVIDDGGHQVDQQITTLEELLPHLSRGGVYICEDIAGVHNPIHDYLAGLYRNLDAWNAPDRLQSRTIPNGFQQAVASIHRYPYLLVIERTEKPPREFVCPRYGTEWQPF